MHYETIIFDLDGTLLNTLDDLTNAVNYALKIHDFPLHTLEDIRNFIGNGTRMLIKRSLPHDVNNELYEVVYKDFLDYYTKHSFDYTRPYNNIVCLLTKLKTLGYKIAIISNKNDNVTNAMQKKYFPNLIDIAIGTKNFSKVKPNPESTLQVIKTLKSTKQKSIFVGDSEVDIQTAKNAGISCISVSWGFRSKTFLLDHNAEIIIDNPLELLNLI